MNSLSKYRTGLTFVGGIVVGMLVGAAILRVGGFVLVTRQVMDEQTQLMTALQEENYELTNDLFAYQGPDVVFDTTVLPYGHDADASSVVASARRKAREDKKFLMITFGANWCVDCRTLYHNLQDPEVQEYTADTLDFVNINVGKFNTNVDLAADLGVDIQHGIPIAIFFGPDGEVIGTTDEGQLEPARFYTSRQILKFVRNVVEKSLIVPPDSVH